MSSLWTPDGERPVRRPASGAGGGPGPTAGGGPTGPGPSGGGNPPGAGDPGAAEAELARLRHELSRVPAAVVVANHAYGLFELAAIHLSNQPPNLAEARLAVDALGAIVETLGDRLDEATGPLHDALAQIRLAFVQLSAADAGAPAADAAPPSAG